jgi:hypothetical protein
MIDYSKIKLTLLGEYKSAGRRTEAEEKAFLEGMTYLESLLTESGQDRLNDAVPENITVRRLESGLAEERDKVRRLEEKLRKFQHNLASFVHLSAKQKKELKTNNYIAELTQQNESLQRLVTKLIQERNGNNPT